MADGQVFLWSSRFDLPVVFAEGGNTGGHPCMDASGTCDNDGVLAPANPSGN